jgi:hypothetical protein
MKCHEVNELIQRSFDEDLCETEQQELETHLETCEECQAFYMRLKEVHLGLVNLPRVTPPINIVDSILPQLELLDRQNSVGGESIEQSEPVVYRLFNRKWIRPLTAVAAAVLIALTFYQLQDEVYDFEERTDFSAESASVSQINEGTVTISNNLEGVTNEDPNQVEQNVDSNAGNEEGADPGATEGAGVSSEGKVTLNGDSTGPYKSEPHHGVEKTDTVKGSNLDGSSTEPKATGEVGNSPSEQTNEVVERREIAKTPPTGTEEQPKYGITSVPPSEEGNSEPTEQTINSKDDPVTKPLNVIDWTEISSPGKVYVAFVNPSVIEIKNLEEMIVQRIEANEGETFSDVLWLDDNSLQVSIRTAQSIEVKIIQIDSVHNEQNEESERKDKE